MCKEQSIALFCNENVQIMSKNSTRINFKVCPQQVVQVNI